MEQNKFYIIVVSLYVIVIGYDVINWLRYRKLSSAESKIKRLRSTVNFLVLITSCILTVFAILLNVNILNYRVPVEYEQVNELTLQDFKGFKIPGKTLHGENDFAFIVTSIEYECHQNQVIIRSLFHPSRSYVYNENLVDNSLLRHELYHFHITELFARKVRRELKEFKVCPSDGDVSEVIKRFKDLENGMQQEYDNKSYHSYVLKEQKKWENKIDSLLTLHENYASSTVTF